MEGGRWTYRQTDRKTDIQIESKTGQGREIEVQTGRHVDRQIERQNDRVTGRIGKGGRIESGKQTETYRLEQRERSWGGWVVRGGGGGASMRG